MPTPFALPDVRVGLRLSDHYQVQPDLRQGDALRHQAVGPADLGMAVAVVGSDRLAVRSAVVIRHCRERPAVGLVDSQADVAALLIHVDEGGGLPKAAESARRRAG